MSENTYKVLITTAGREKLAAALAAGTTVQLKQIALGDGNGKFVEPTETQTALAREVYRADMLSCTPLSSAPENIVCVLAIPASAGGWTVREIGIFDVDGEMFAVGNIAEAYKPAPSEGTSREMLLRCVIGIGAANAVELVTDPAQVIATQEYVQTAINEMIHGIGELGDELREWAEIIGKYKYVVCTREEYDDLVEAETIEENVIYFVKGTKSCSDAVTELAKRVSSNEESISKINTSVEAINTRMETLAELPENIASDLALLARKHEGDTQAQTLALENLAQEVDANREELNKLAESLTATGTETDEKLSGVEERLSTDIEKVNEVVLQEATLRQESEKALTDSIQTLAETVSQNSDSVADHENRIVQLETEFSEIDNRQEEFTQSVSAALTSMNTKVSAVETEITEAQKEHAPLLDTVPGTANDNASSVFGYLGTLEDLGAFGEACAVRIVTVRTRLSGTLSNASVPIWARILKVVDDAWVVAAQSEHSLKCADFGTDADMPFLMRSVPGVVPPSASETIAIVFVNSATASAGTSNGGFSLRCISGQGGGGFGSALNTPSSATPDAGWKPLIKLRFAAMSDATPKASVDDFNGLVDATGEAFASVQVWLNDLEARVTALENSTNG